mmetsp:Transcript_55969/g.64620  ORF Transcript_55969/g.64620 Transcript_55969/m.64620 type:complete len:119 (+) Transcript_55969:45-401(+)
MGLKSTSCKRIATLYTNFQPFTMILKTLFLCVLGFDFVLNQASAQFNHHHQQYFSDLTGDYNKNVFDTKALTPVQIGKKGTLNWTFASTIDVKGSDLWALLVKLRDNISAGNPPFKVE